MDLQIYLTNDQADRLFRLKKAAGRDEMTAQDFAQELMDNALTGQQMGTRAIDRALVSISGDCEMLRALITMHESHVDAHGGGNVETEYRALLEQRIASIEAAIRKLEDH